MDHLGRLIRSKSSVAIPTDENGFTGRECPQGACEGYFKIVFGTGLQGEGLPCHCPYCGHIDQHNAFWTKEQIRYVRSVALKKVRDALHKDLKQLEFDQKPKGAFGIGVSMKLKPGRPTRVHHYREKQLETEVVCAGCTLRYSVYGVFAFCPDCGQHNSLQILQRNLNVVGKMLDLALGAEEAMKDSLIENGLEDCVSAFDGFARELCRVHAHRASNLARATSMSFQNLARARTDVISLFGVDMGSAVAPEDWHDAITAFQKRHLVAHKLGVMDQAYAENAQDPSAVVGRKVEIQADGVRRLIATVGGLAASFSHQLQDLAR